MDGLIIEFDTIEDIEKAELQRKEHIKTMGEAYGKI